MCFYGVIYYGQRIYELDIRWFLPKHSNGSQADSNARFVDGKLY